MTSSTHLQAPAAEPQEVTQLQETVYIVPSRRPRPQQPLQHIHALLDLGAHTGLTFKQAENRVWTSP